MNDLFLILHKVRGEPTFDVALRCSELGTPTDPGPWWIIPTSGHRAYPGWTVKLDNLYSGPDWCTSYIQGLLGVDEVLPKLPDHYPTTHVVKSRPKVAPPRSLHSALDLL